MQALANRMREAREQKGITQAALAKELNVKPATISRYESNASDPDSETILWYAKRFNVSLDWLFGVTEVPNPPTVAVNLNADLRERLMSNSARHMTDEQLAAALPEDVREAVLALIRIERAKGK